MLIKFTSFVLALVLLSACSNSTTENANTNETAGDTVKVVQSFYPDSVSFDVAKAITVADLKTQMNGKDSLFVMVSANVSQTCTKMGCWMDIKDEGAEDIKVRMKDHNFFVPKAGCEGKKCVIEGLAYRTTFTEEERLHYAMESDMSQAEIDAIKGPQDVLTITAYRVMIEDAPIENTESNEGEHDHDHEHGHEDHEHHDHGGQE